MNQIIHMYRSEIDKCIFEFCKSANILNLPWTEDVAQRLYDFCHRGKMVRGSMVAYTCNIFQSSVDKKEILNIAASIELVHAALLIHDDIIDHDTLRRGQDSLHIQYQQLGKQKSVRDAEKFGEVMALCVGDIAIFKGFSHLAEASIPPDIHIQLFKTVTKEFLTVGFGELHDIALGYIPDIPASEEVLSMYVRKTARYTFSLPFILGCILSQQSSNVTHQMELLGEQLGIIFQLQDDMLTITGDQEKVGKTVGNDISENKKTYAAVLLWNRVDSEEKSSLERIFGNSEITQKNIQYVIDLMKQHDVIKDLQDKIEQNKNSAINIIEQLPVEALHKKELKELVDYLTTRNT